MHSRRCFPHWQLANQQLLVLFLLWQISRRDPSYLKFQVLWLAPELTSTHRTLLACLAVCFWSVVAVSMAHTNSVRHNTSLGMPLPTPSCSLHPRHARSGLQCIDTSDICVHLRNLQFDPEYNGTYRAPSRADTHLIYMSCYDIYTG